VLVLPVPDTIIENLLREIFAWKQEYTLGARKAVTEGILSREEE